MSISCCEHVKNLPILLSTFPDVLKEFDPQLHVFTFLSPQFFKHYINPYCIRFTFTITKTSFSYHRMLSYYRSPCSCNLSSKNCSPSVSVSVTFSFRCRCVTFENKTKMWVTSKLSGKHSLILLSLKNVHQNKFFKSKVLIRQILSNFVFTPNHINILGCVCHNFTSASNCASLTS